MGFSSHYIREFGGVEKLRPSEQRSGEKSGALESQRHKRNSGYSISPRSGTESAEYRFEEVETKS